MGAITVGLKGVMNEALQLSPCLFGISLVLNQQLRYELNSGEESFELQCPLCIH
jgi:hypothetical protein